MITLKVDNTCKPDVLQQYYYSNFNIIIKSGALSMIKGLVVEKTVSSYQLSVLVKYENDFRWHQISDKFDSLPPLKHFALEMIGVISKTDKENYMLINHWKTKINKLNDENCELNLFESSLK